MNPWPVEAAHGGGAPAAPGPRRPRRDAEVRAHRRARHPRARERARDGGAGSRAARSRKAFLEGARRRGVQPRDPDHRASARRGATTSTPADFEHVDESPVRCLDADATKAMVAEIDRLRKANESLGGVFEVRAFGLVPGLGSHVSWEERLDGRLGAGDALDPGDQGGVDRRRVRGRRRCPAPQAHDEIFYDEQRGYYRETNRAGGVEGGMTTGDAAGRAGLDEAAADADQAAALGRHRDPRARRGAARADGLVHGAGGRRGGGGDGRVRARRRLPDGSSAATTSTTSAPRSRRTSSESGGDRR